MTNPAHLAAGIHGDIEADTYHADTLTPEPALSAGAIKTITQHSPLHAWHQHPRLNPDHRAVERDTFDLGTVAHLLLLEGSAYASQVQVIEANDWRTKAAQEAKAEAREAGRTPLLARDWQRVTDMAHAVEAQLLALPVTPAPLTNGQPEQTVVWQEDNGVWCRARIDWLHNDLTAIDDLKTTGRTGNPIDWARTAFWSLGCDIQTAFYLRGIERLTGQTPDWRYVVVENTPPYALSIVTVGASALDLGRQKVERAIRVWGECLESGAWPGYGTAAVDLRGWEEADFLVRTYEIEGAAA